MEDSKQQLKKTVKKHIPKDWLCELRIAYRIVMEAVNDIKRTGIVNIIIVTTMLAILTLFGSLFRLTFTLSSFTKEFGNMLEISVYLKQNADISITKKRIENINYVKKVKLITKEEAWKDMKTELSLQEFSNPLPDTLRVKVDNSKHINEVTKQIRNIPSVDETGYGEEIAKKMQIASNVVNTTMFIVMVILAIITITIINNTIQLVIQSRKEEIEIMRLMGVSNWYIKTPLIMQGAAYGFVSAILATLPLIWVQNLLINMHKHFFIPNPEYAQTIVIVSMLLIGTSFGAFGSFLSIKKHLQV